MVPFERSTLRHIWAPALNINNQIELLSSAGNQC